MSLVVNIGNNSCGSKCVYPKLKNSILDQVKLLKFWEKEIHVLYVTDCLQTCVMSYNSVFIHTSQLKNKVERYTFRYKQNYN